MLGPSRHSQAKISIPVRAGSGKRLATAAHRQATVAGSCALAVRTGQPNRPAAMEQEAHDKPARPAGARRPPTRDAARKGRPNCATPSIGHRGQKRRHRTDERERRPGGSKTWRPLPPDRLLRPPASRDNGSISDQERREPATRTRAGSSVARCNTGIRRFASRPRSDPESLRRSRFDKSSSA